jgi:hypothetical protein
MIVENRWAPAGGTSRRGSRLSVTPYGESADPVYAPIEMSADPSAQ